MEKKFPPYREKQPFRTSAFGYDNEHGATCVMFWIYVMDKDKEIGGIKKYTMVSPPNGGTSVGFASECHVLEKRWSFDEAFEELMSLERKHTAQYKTLPDNDALLKPYAMLHNFSISASLVAVSLSRQHKDPTHIAQRALSSKQRTHIRKAGPKKP